MFTVTLEGDTALRVRLEALGRDTPRAITRALNRVLTSVRRQVLQALAAELQLAQKDIGKGVTPIRATFSLQEALLKVTGRRLPLLAFAARQTRTGVTYRLGRGRGLVPSAFLATVGAGHQGVFKRRIPSRSRAGLPSPSPGLPIVELFGPSLPGVVIRQRIFEALQAQTSDELRQRLEHEIQFLADRGALAAGGD